ncbi:hypothetical protein ACFWY9_28570 [Amycolatopsis sp. NPDC059027]|uniref:hypothetical protein n=1 Tax=Amycolatopsis sp. NPDC059027 TaxID=3346709 RepID=UPI00366C9FC3
MANDIRLAGSVEEAIKILNDRIEGMARRRKPSSAPRYLGVASAPFDGAGPITLAASSGALVSSVSVPDPGYPYQIEVSAGLFIRDLPADAGTSHYLSARVDAATFTHPSTPLGTGVIGSAFIGQMGGSSSGFAYATLFRRSPAVWTGTHTVSFALFTGPAGTATVPTPLANRSDFYFDVRVIPSTA